MVTIIKKEGFVLNPKGIPIINMILRNDGFCPCSSNTSEDKKCPCSNFRNKDECICNLYIKKP